MSLIRQLSLFSADASRPEPADLAGLLASAGEVSRMGLLARVSVVVDHPWRSTALVSECARRGLVATGLSTVDEHIEVRTVFTAALTPLADAWLQAEVKRPPPGLVLDGRALRLWAVATGRADGLTTYLLPLGAARSPLPPGSAAPLGAARTPLPLSAGEAPAWAAVGAALAMLGLPGQLVSPRSGPPSYRIVGRRRIGRLAELVGDPPKQAPSGVWPS